MKIVELPLDRLNGFDGNPRIASPEAREKLKDSLRKFGLFKPLVVHGSPPVVIGGNQRLSVLREMAAAGEKVPALVTCVEFGGSEEEARVVALRDNSQTGSWDMDILPDFVSDLKGLLDEDFDMSLTGFDDKTLADLEALAADHETGMELDPSGLPSTRVDWVEPPENPVSVCGEIYQLGPHRLACGDSTSTELSSALFGDETFDLMLTDPPYGVSYSEKNKFLETQGAANRITKDIAGDHLQGEDLRELWRGAFNNALLRAGEKASFYAFCAQGGTLQMDMMGMLQECGWQLRQGLVWVKSSPVFGRSDYMYKHEPILYGWRKGSSHRFYGNAKQVSVWEFAKPSSSWIHPTMKPVELLERAVRNSTRKGDIVYDPFGGSGATLMAAARQGRRARLIELDLGYCDAIRARWGAWAREAGVDAGPDAL